MWLFCRAMVRITQCSDSCSRPGFAAAMAHPPSVGPGMRLFATTGLSTAECQIPPIFTRVPQLPAIVNKRWTTARGRTDALKVAKPRFGQRTYGTKQSHMRHQVWDWVPPESEMLDFLGFAGR